MTVEVTSLVGPTYSNDAGFSQIECDLSLRAHNAGSRTAAWLGASLAFYSPLDSLKPAAIDTLDAASIGSSWGSDSLRADSARTARWGFASTVPFTLTFRFYYDMPGRPRDSTAVSASCEPTTVPGPPPAITDLEVQPNAVVQPGDTLHIRYITTSAQGLWQSFLDVSGPCDTVLPVPELARTAATHDLVLVLPPSCALGIQPHIAVTVYDTRLQSSTRSLDLPPLVDTRRPGLSANLSTPYAMSPSLAAFSGFVFVGDQLNVGFSARDNHSVRAVSWEVQPVGLRDSVLGQGPQFAGILQPPIQSAWPGPVVLRVVARDESGNASDTLATTPGALEVYPTVGPAAVPTSAGGDIGDVRFDQKRDVLYVLQSNSYRIALRSSKTGALQSTITMPDYASGFDLSPSGDSIITCLKNLHALGVVDLTQASPALAVVPLPGLDSSYRLLNVRVASTGRAILATQHVLGGEKRLYSYDLGTGTLRLRNDAPDLGVAASGHMERSGDGMVIVVNGAAGAFLRYDAAADAFGPGLTARTPDTRVTVDATGAHVAVAGDLYDGSLQYQRTVRAAQYGAGAAALSADGLTHYLAIGPGYLQLGIVRSQASDGGIVDHLAVPMVVTQLRLSPDGTLMAVVEGYNYSGRIAVVDLTKLL